MHAAITDEAAFAAVDGDAGIVGHLGMGAGQAIEQNGLAAVGRAQQCKGGGTGLAGLAGRLDGNGLVQGGGCGFSHDQARASVRLWVLLVLPAWWCEPPW